MATVGFDVAVALYVAYMTVLGGKAGAETAAPARKLAARSRDRKGAAQ
jgi:hypothetical protein